MAAAQINTFTEVLEKAQRIEIARAQVRNFHAKWRGAPDGSQGPAQSDRNMPPLKWVVELEVEGLLVYPGKVSREESKVEGDPKVVGERERRPTGRPDIRPLSIMWVLWEVELYRGQLLEKSSKMFKV